MYRTTFNHILDLVLNKISTAITDVGRHTINSKTQLLMAIWYFATPDTYRSICGRFNIGRATGIRSVRRLLIII
ncbi:unnamed protein product [Tenebrio molitor]|nr:unnamed protein product [Tenebrio molitor]